MNKKERLEAIIKHYSDGKPSVFAKLIGVAPSTISSWLSRDTLDYDLLFAKCENLSSEWLLTGRGEMINIQTATFNNTTTPVSYTHLQDTQGFPVFGRSQPAGQGEKPGLFHARKYQGVRDGLLLHAA